MAKTKTRRYYLYYLLRVLFFLISLLPLKIALAISDFLGKVIFKMLPKYSQVAVDNLDSKLGGRHEDNVRIGENLFSNLLKNGAEWIKLSTMDPARLTEIVTECEGIERLDGVLSEGKGAIVMGFHFGNWELLGLYMKHLGYDGALVAKRLYFHKYNKLVARLRERFGARIIYRDESPKKMLKELKNGNVLGIVPDQDVKSIEGVYVDFFGTPAYTPSAPVKLAMVSGAKIVPIFIVRKKDNTHKMVVEEPIAPIVTGDKDEDARRYTQEWTSLLEKYVRKYPDQWVWLHKRWKTQEKQPV